MVMWLSNWPGANTTVISILSNPDQDPHVFEASPSIARDLSAASIVVTMARTTTPG
jgi:ABC-type Zn uptake system ZnuABC Zn-binding protein ZnuA